MASGLTMVMLISSESDASDATARCLGWVIRPELAEAFADGMTETCGEPVHEALAQVSDMVAAAQRNDNREVIAPGRADA